jgi:hypothetical protein
VLGGGPVKPRRLLERVGDADQHRFAPRTTEELDAHRHSDRSISGEPGYGRDNALAAELALAERNDDTLLVRIGQGIELIFGPDLHDLHDPLPQLHPLDEARIVVGIALVERLRLLDLPSMLGENLPEAMISSSDLTGVSIFGLER